MNYMALAALAGLLLIGCSSSDRIDEDVFDVVNQTEIVQRSTAVSCDMPNEHRGIKFRQKCWELEFTARDANNIELEVVRLGYALRGPEASEVEIIETKETGFFLVKKPTQGKCSNYIKTRITPSAGKALTDRKLELMVGITSKPYCGDLGLG